MTTYTRAGAITMVVAVAYLWLHQQVFPLLPLDTGDYAVAGLLGGLVAALAAWLTQRFARPATPAPTPAPAPAPAAAEKQP